MVLSNTSTSTAIVPLTWYLVPGTAVVPVTWYRATQGAREGLDGSSEGEYVGLWNEIRRVAKGCSQGGQTFSAKRGESRVVHAEFA